MATRICGHHRRQVSPTLETPLILDPGRRALALCAADAATEDHPVVTSRSRATIALRVDDPDQSASGADRARADSSMRLRAPVLRRMFDTWLLTVLSLMNSRVAIWL